MSYTLYGENGTATFSPQAVLEEAGIPYEFVQIDLAAGEHHGAAYHAINPAEYVPALKCPDGTVLYEAAAIMLYLADHHGLSDLAPAADDPARGVLYRTMFYMSSTLQEACKMYFHADHFATKPDAIADVAANSLTQLATRWQVVEDHLAAHGPYHLGERFSLSDIYMTMLVSWHEPMEELLERCPAIARCHDLVCKRPALQGILKTHSVI